MRISDWSSDVCSSDLAFGAAAWTPLMAWNMDNAEAGLRFQLVDRHPWAFHADGLLFIAIQGLLAPPLLFVALMSAAARRGWMTDSQRYLAWLGGLDRKRTRLNSRP